MISRTQTKQRLVILLLLAILAGCTFPGSPPGTVIMPAARDQINTAAAKTVSAMGTLVAEGFNPTMIGMTATPVLPTRTPTLTLTPTVTKTNPPSGDCNQASFVGDVTVPDGSILPPNSVFTKTWEIKNTGSCAWNSSYAVVFAGRGSAMGGPASTPVVSAGEIKPGETARVSVTLRSPNEPGEYEGYWLLNSGDNKAFGTGVNGGSPFFVKITVAEGYSFAEHWCSAKWTTGAGDLPCPGSQDDSRGYVLRVENPTLEDGNSREGLGLLAAAQPVAGGMITARYPAVIVPVESDFRATIGCQREATGCFVRFRVTYRANGGDEKLLGEWNEGNEGGVTEAVKDLDMVAGQSVEFIFSVVVAGPPDKARGIWFNPRITK